MKPQNRIILISVLAGLGFWIIDSILDVMFFDPGEPFLNVLILDPTPYEIYIRSLSLVIFVAMGILISRAEAQRKRDEDKIRKLAAIVESSDDAIISKNLDGIITSWNKGAENIYGYSEAEIIGKPVSILVPDNCPDEIPILLDKLKRKEHIVHYETTRVRKDRRNIQVSLTLSPIVDGKGTIIGASTIASDITQLKQIEKQLAAQEKLSSIGQLASGVAHEINNPLSSVIGFSDLLLQSDLPDDVKDNLKIVNEQGKRAARIVEDLISFAEEQPMEKQAISINDALLEVLAPRRRGKLSTVQVNTQFADNLPPISGNTSQLKEVFFSVILNAEQAMLDAHDKGILTITTQLVGDAAKISFADDGPGISPENMKKLFTPFFTTKEVDTGKGLALSVSRSIITEHHGKIYAESEFGKGATFIVELPIASPGQ